jgi:hypothetical protein
MATRTSPTYSRANCCRLSPRAALRRTFGGMATFVSLPLLGLGAYLIKDQFENPVGSHPAGLLFAAVLIAAALVLLSYLIYPGGTREPKAVNPDPQEDLQAERTIDVSGGTQLVLRGKGFDLPVQGRYVDRERIRS